LLSTSVSDWDLACFSRNSQFHRRDPNVFLWKIFESKFHLLQLLPEALRKIKDFEHISCSIRLYLLSYRSLSLSCICKLNFGIFRIFELSESNLNLIGSNCRASKNISNDTELEQIPLEPNMENPIFHFCVGVWVGEHASTDFSHTVYQKM